MKLTDKWHMMQQIVRQCDAEIKEEKRNLKQMKVYRTTEGTVFEVVCSVLLLATWTIFLIAWLQDGFVFTGRHIACFAFTLVVPFLLYAAYRPEWSNIGEKIENSRQLALAVQATRVYALLFSLTALTSAVRNLSPAIDRLPIWGGFKFTFLLLAISFFYNYRIRKNKNQTT